MNVEGLTDRESIFDRFVAFCFVSQPAEVPRFEADAHARGCFVSHGAE